MSPRTAFISTARIYGGGESVLAEALRHFQATEPGSTVLLTPPNPRLEAEASSCGVGVLPSPFIRTLGEASGPISYLWSVLRSNFWLLREARRQGFSSLVLNGPGALPATLLLRMLTRVRITTWVHTVISRGFYRAVLGWCYWGHALICVSEAAAKPLKTRWNSSKLQVIHNGVEVPATPSVQPMRRPLRILNAGRIMEGKGVHVLIEALGHLSASARATIRVDIAGKAWSPEDEHYLSALKARATELGLDSVVRFVGFLALPGAMAEYDVLVFTSLLEEACPMAILEAMAHGMLVVAARAGGVTEIIEDGKEGLLFKQRDHEGLSSMLESLAFLEFTEMRRLAATRVESDFDHRKQLALLRQAVT